MRTLSFLSLILAALFVLGAVDAHAQSCQRSKPETEVKRITLKTKYYRGTSAWYLTAWTGHWGKGVVLGLHSGQGDRGPFWADYKTQFDFTPVRNNNSLVCVTVKKIVLHFYIQPIVHIASEYPPESCEFKQILKHEKKHVAVTKQWQKDYTPMLRRELDSIARKLPAGMPVGEKTVPSIQEANLNIIRSHLDKFMEQKAIPDYIRRQNKVDDPLEYMLVPTRCENWQEYHMTAYE